MDPTAIIHEYYRPGDTLTRVLLDHGRKVADRALAAAARLAHLQPDLEFIAQAALLHDIGIFQTAAPSIECHGSLPYVCHGIIGRRLLEEHGLPAHALVCERHVGTGITQDDIISQKLPLPLRDMQPVSIEEILICYADKFFSKKTGGQEHTLEAVLTGLARHGKDKAERFLGWHRQFGG